jgi:hypothetical protein
LNHLAQANAPRERIVSAKEERIALVKPKIYLKGDKV